MTSDEIYKIVSEKERLASEVNRLQEEVDILKHNLKLLRKSMFGAKSEKYEDLPAEQLLFNELEVTKKEDPEQIDLIEVSAHKKKGRGVRKPFPADLPREVVIIDLPESEKMCPHDNTALKLIGEEVTEKLKVVPAKISIVVEKKKKYACPCCELHMAQAKADSILPGTIATVEILAFLFFSKYYQALPLYRLEEYFKLQGIELSRGTMASWLIKIAEKLQPIWNVLEDWVIDSGYMGIDATSMQVLKEPNRKAETKSFMWARGSPELGIVLFDYNISGSGSTAEQLMAGFSGAMQSDAHRGYNKLNNQVTRLGCMMHSRRKFYEAFVSVNKKPGLAENAIKMIKKIYKFEEAYKTQALTSEQRKVARQNEVKPYMEKFKNWCEDKKSKVPPSSPLAIAINYYLEEYEYLTKFLEDGRYEIDNGWIERGIRKFAIGRNNWMFADSVEGAKASSLFYSLSVTAKLNDKDPYEVMKAILQKISSAQTIDDYEKLAKLLVKTSNVN
jgi:transposase